MSVTTLHPAPPETWGQMLQRCRQSVISSGETVEELTENFVSNSALGRLEQRETPPDRRDIRRKAAVVVVLCGYDPEDFGVSLSDLPTYLNADRLAELRSRLYRCTNDPGIPALAPAA